MTTLNAAAAREHRSDLLREAVAQQRASSAVEAAGRPLERQRLTLRLADATDGRAVRRLEALDDTTALAGRILLALRDGEAIAALSLTDGHVAANPFEPTANAVALLRLRAEHLAQPGRHARRWHPRSLRRLHWA